jgi:hypothetical protein
MTVVRTQTVITKHKIRLFVDKASQQWIVQDIDGTFWVLASHDNPWEQRQAIQSTEQLQLEPVPGHYKHMLGIPG